MGDAKLLATDVQESGSGAVQVLLDRHRGRLAACVASRLPPDLRGSIEPDDIVQETCLEAARQVSDFGDPSSREFYPWLVQIAATKLIEADGRRGRSPREAPRPLDAEAAAAQASVAGRVGRGEHALWVADVIERLPEDEAASVRLRYLEGLTMAEAAARLVKPERVVRALVAQGMARLAVLLREPA